MPVIKCIREIFIVLAESRSSIFIGVTAIMVAILVFIAGILSNEKVLEVEKKTLLDKLKLKSLLNCSIVVLLFSWFLELGEKFCTGEPLIIILIFSLLEIIEFCFIIYISFRVCRVFGLTIEMIKSITIKNDAIKTYTLEKCSDYIELYKNFDNCTSKNMGEIKRLIAEYNDLFQFQCFEKVFSKYDKICLKQNGYIESINIEKLENILQELKNAKIGDSYETNINEGKIIITHYPGDKIRADEVLFYISGNINKAFFYNLVNINTNKSLLEKEINDNFKDIIHSVDNEVFFDQNNLLKDLYKELLNLNEKSILAFFNNQIFSDFNRKMKLKEKLTARDMISLQERLEFFLKIEQVDDDSKVNNSLEIESFIHEICLKVIFHTENSKDFAYYYATNIFDYLLFNCEIGNITSLYINNLSYLLTMVINLLETGKFEEVKIIAKNLYVENNHRDQIIYNYEFLMGLVKLYIVLLQRDKKNNTDIVNENWKILGDIYRLFESKILDINEEIDFNKLFIDLLELSSDKINSSIDFIEYDLLSDKYSSSYCGFAVLQQEVMLYLFLTLYNHLIDDNKSIFKDDIDLVAKMRSYLEYMNNYNINDKLLEIFVINKNVVDLFRDEFISPLLDKVIEEEHKYISKTDITEEIKEIRKKLSKLIDIKNSINFDYVNVKIIKSKSQKCLSKYDIFSIKYFKEFLTKKEILESKYKDVFTYPLLDKIREILNDKAIKVEDTLDNYLKRLKNSNYFIITDAYMYTKIKDYGEKYNIKIFDTLKTDYLSRGQIFIINKEDMPIIELHEIDEENNSIEKENIMNKYQYIEIKRLSDRKQKDKIKIDDKLLTDEEKKDYVYVRVLIAVLVKVNNKHDIVLFEEKSN